MDNHIHPTNVMAAYRELMEVPCCGSCASFDLEESDLPSGGYCHKRAPSLHTIVRFQGTDWESGDFDPAWPDVRAYNLCGDWRHQECPETDPIPFDVSKQKENAKAAFDNYIAALQEDGCHV